MVGVGFIVEGETEKVLIDSTRFRDWCQHIGIKVIEPVIDAGGSGNLLPQNINNYLNEIKKGAPIKIVVLTDLDFGESVDEVKSRIIPDPQVTSIDVVFVAVKAVESWFLADSNALQKWLKESSYDEEQPEDTDGLPWDRLREIAKDHNVRGTGASKPTFARRMTKTYGFSIESAANHPACPSVKYFHDTLVRWGS